MKSFVKKLCVCVIVFSINLPRYYHKKQNAAMALRGWRLFGVAGTIFVYIIGILLLSLMSIQTPSQKRSRTRLYNEADPFQTRVIGLLGKHQPLQWCRELQYLHKRPTNKTKIYTNQLLQTFPGHFVKRSNINAINNRNELDKFYKNNKIKSHNEIKFEYEPISYDNKLRNNFDDISSHHLTALASFPGSGNTWLRYLLQQSTGIYTGSVYKDYGLLKSGFPGENVFNSSVLVIKTHEWGNKAYKMFSKAILLVRDPEKAILAEFNRQSGGHVGFASNDRYTRTKGRYWQQFVTNKLWAWEKMNVAWAKSFTGDVKIVYYNDLIDNLETRLREIISFINYPIDEELFACAIRRREGIYRRKKKTMIFDPYTVEMHRLINATKEEVYGVLGRNKF